MIAAERHTDPLSDVALTQNLAGRGILLARRTVTKYRQAMKIPPAELRRRDAA
jgi:RNA polymerase sigma-54 factor